MDIHSDYVEPATSAYENVSFSKAEDSGYHTFTPGSLECAEISNNYLDHSVITSNDITGITGQIQFGYIQVNPDVNIHCRRYTNSAGNESLSGTPPFRRGCKRPHSSTVDKTDTSNNSVPTPTSFIAGKIKSLDVNENKENSEILSPVRSQCSEKLKRRLYQHDFDPMLYYPSTPVKKNCKRSPCRKSGRNPSFAIHSLSCETNGLLGTNNIKAQSKVVRNINFWPDQKVDIIKKLDIDSVMQILSYLSNEDIHNFNSVSKTWKNIWNSVNGNNKMKKEYEYYLKTVKENQENRDKGITPKTKNNILQPVRRLRELNDNPVQLKPQPAPPVSPRTNRFMRFTKSASLDSRSQMPCERCHQPAKVTEEPSGEVWVECTRNSCLYIFCKFCRCPRHPGKSCFRYDLNSASPSKRKKNQFGIGTKNSRKRLLRL